MNVTMFLTLLAAFALLSSLITEGIKNLVKDRENLPTNIVAIIIGLLVGGVGTGFYYVLNDITFDSHNIIYLILMGFANGLCAMVGYDKFMQTLQQCGIAKDSK
jgi:uncharacterized membrane protein YczE